MIRSVADDQVVIARIGAIPVYVVNMNGGGERATECALGTLAVHQDAAALEIAGCIAARRWSEPVTVILQKWQGQTAYMAESHPSNPRDFCALAATASAKAVRHG